MIVGLQAVQSREDRPWIITAGHRPMYCSTVPHIGDDNCDHRESIVRILHKTEGHYSYNKS